MLILRIGGGGATIVAGYLGGGGEPFNMLTPLQ